MKLISLKPITYDFLSEYNATYCNLAESTENEWLESDTYAENAVVKVSTNEDYREVFIATAAQTVFTFEHVVGEIAVYQNTVLLVDTTDYVDSDTAKITLNSGATVDDDIEILRLDNTARLAPVKTYRKTSTGTNTYPPGDDLTNWLDLGATNRWAMFDQYVFTSSESPTAAVDTPAVVPSTFTVEIDTSNANYLGLFNLNCSQIEVQYQKSSEGYNDFNPTNFPKVQEIIDYHPYEFHRDTKVWLDYLFGDFVWKRDIIFPIQWDKVSSVRITFTNNAVGQKASCGMCVCGQSYYIGKTQYGASSGILSYSKKDENETTGATFLKKGNNAKRFDLDISIKNEQYNKIHAIMTAADGVPVIIQGNNEDTSYEPFMVYGFIKSFDMSLQYPTHSEFNIEGRGLI